MVNQGRLDAAGGPRETGVMAAKPTEIPKGPRPDPREDRLAKALRENLRRRRAAGLAETKDDSGSSQR